MDRSRPLAHRIFAMASAFAFVGFAAACDSGTQEPDAPAESSEYGAAPPADSPSAAATAPEIPRDGSIAAERFPEKLPDGITAEVPHNFPSSIPIYPGAQAAQGKGADDAGSALSGLQLLSNDPPTQIYAFYEDELKSKGWEITESSNDNLVSSITATNGSLKTAVFIQASPMGGSDIFIINE
jgi:hypothetical protein